MTALSVGLAAHQTERPCRVDLSSLLLLFLPLSARLDKNCTESSHAPIFPSLYSSFRDLTRSHARETGRQIEAELLAMHQDVPVFVRVRGTFQKVFTSARGTRSKMLGRR